MFVFRPTDGERPARHVGRRASRLCNRLCALPRAAGGQGHSGVWSLAAADFDVAADRRDRDDAC